MALRILSERGLSERLSHWPTFRSATTTNLHVGHTHQHYTCCSNPQALCMLVMQPFFILLLLGILHTHSNKAFHIILVIYLSTLPHIGDSFSSHQELSYAFDLRTKLIPLNNPQIKIFYFFGLHKFYYPIRQNVSCMNVTDSGQSDFGYYGLQS